MSFEMKEVMIRTVQNGGYVVLEPPSRSGSSYASPPQLIAAFTNFDDMVKGMAAVFEVSQDDLDIGYLQKKMSG